MTRLGIAILLVCVLAYSGRAQSSGLILNEVLANEPGSDVNAEWVELLNWPDVDSAVICLDGYTLVDGTDSSHYDTSYCLPPGGYLIIARDTTTFESIWGNNSGAWGDDPSEDYPLLGGDFSLRNSSDTLVLIAPGGDTSAIYWTTSSDDSTSWERIRPNGGDEISNFADCSAPRGSTPGRENSVFPVRGDFAIDSIVVVGGPIVYSQRGTFRVYYTNVGIGPADRIVIQIFDDRNWSSPGSVLEPLVLTLGNKDLPDGASDYFEWNIYMAQGDGILPFSPGIHRVVARIWSDGNADNNEAAAVVTAEYSSPLLIISEFLANPDAGDPDEWVEIVNLAEQPLSMRGLRIGDSSGTSAIPTLFEDYIQPEQYWVLAQNEAAFLSRYPDFGGTLVEVPSWKELNNSGDRVTLVGAGGEIIDSVSFRKTNDRDRSWERLDLSIAHALIDDWTPSVDPSGATPGRANSVDRDRAGTFEVSLSPNPIHLSTGGAMTIDFQLDIGERLTLKIFDRSGRLVRTLADDIPAATGSVSWDATADDGSRVSPGPYILLGQSKPAGASCKEVLVVAP